MAVRVEYTYRHSYCELRGYSYRGGLGSEWQYVYSTCTATVTVTYADTLTERGRGVSGSTCRVHVYTTSVTVTYVDTLTEGGRRVSGSTCTVHVPPELLRLTRILQQRRVGERVAVRVKYTYSHSYCDLGGYSDRGGYGCEWQYVYSTRTDTITVTYADTLTEGGRGESGSMCTVHVPPQLL